MNNTIRLFIALALFSLTASGCRSAIATTTEVVAVQAKTVPPRRPTRLGMKLLNILPSCCCRIWSNRA